MALEAGLVALLKLAFARARPEGAILAASEGFSFPSGHTAAAATLACALVWMGMRRWRHRGLVALLVAGTLWVALMAASRVTLGVHYLSDVLGGAGVGLMVAAAVFARDRDVSPRAPGPVLPLPRGRAQG
jgi:undecaprenyl-diphosphatase